MAIPWADQFRFRHDQTGTGRDHAKYVALIASITLLHQHQRPWKTRVVGLALKGYRAGDMTADAVRATRGGQAALGLDHASHVVGALDTGANFYQTIDAYDRGDVLGAALGSVHVGVRGLQAGVVGRQFLRNYEVRFDPTTLSMSGFGGVRITRRGFSSNSVIPAEMWEAAFGAPRANSIAIDRYGTLSQSPLPGQAHHLNQAAAYRGVIPFEEGASIKLQGNVLSDVGAPHTLAHESLESFWSQYRGTRIVPTNLQYTRALQDSLRAAGLAETNVQQAVRAAIRERVRYGALGGMVVPNVPNPIHNLAR